MNSPTIHLLHICGSGRRSRSSASRLDDFGYLKLKAVRVDIASEEEEEEEKEEITVMTVMAR